MSHTHQHPGYRLPSLLDIILPGPTFPIPPDPDTVREGTQLYGLVVRPEMSNATIRAFDRDMREIAEFQAQVQKNKITGLLTEHGASIKTVVSIESLEKGQILLTGSVNDSAFRFSGTPDAPQEATIEGTICTSLQEWQIRQRWGRLVPSLIHLGRLSSGTTGSTQAKWSCRSCLVLGAAVVASVWTANIGAALGTGATFLENCEGACA